LPCLTLAWYERFFYYDICGIEYKGMHCPRCDVVVVANARYCQACGTRFAPERIFFGRQRAEFALTPDEESWEPGEESLVEHWQPLPTQNISNEDGRAEDNRTIDFQWGGFLRRGFALIIDVLIVLIICLIVFVLCFIGYKVGLAAHDRTLSAQNSPGFISFLTLSWVFLTTSYFVLFHGIGGQTIGKWLLRLRVIGANGARPSYKQAALRWVSELLLAPFIIGILWSIWSREKRTWHDYLARTWVIKE
jgi:uncharacterized RDD family membrane protein YckC